MKTWTVTGSIRKVSSTSFTWTVTEQELLDVGHENINSMTLELLADSISTEDGVEYGSVSFEEEYTHDEELYIDDIKEKS